MLTPSKEFLGESRNLKDYPNFPTIKPKIEKIKHGRISSFGWKGQFVSTYTGDYLGEAPERYLRKKEINGGLNRT